MIEACGKGTYNGATAENSPFGFAACVEPKDHHPPCDSGPVLDMQPQPPYIGGSSE